MQEAAQDRLLLARLHKYVAQVQKTPLAFREDVVNGVAWERADLNFLYPGPGPRSAVVDFYLVYYRPTGAVTLEDVKEVRWRYRPKVMILPKVVVVVAPGGLERAAMSSIRRSKWLDYFDHLHRPAGWPAPRET